MIVSDFSRQIQLTSGGEYEAEKLNSLSSVLATPQASDIFR